MSIIRRLDWAAYPCAGKPQWVDNPFGGLYSIYRFDIGDEISPEQHIPIENCMLHEAQTLCLVEISLMQFAGGPLPDRALVIAERILAYFKLNRRMMILRFLYDWDGRNIQTEPKQLQTIMLHMDQLSPLLMKYAPWIYIIQGLFIGNWGEMHNSRFLSPSALCNLAEHLHQSTDEITFLAVRSPAIWRVIARSFDPLEEREAYTGRVAARIGLFNDGMMASSTDYGTYGSIPRAEARSHGDKWVRDDEIAFQKRLCLYVPCGGEAVNPCPQNDFSNALADLKSTHVSYLNSAYDTAVIKKWRETQMKRSMGAWYGRNGFDYIAAHLGFRYLLEDVKLTVASAAERTLRLLVTIRNEGFAVSYRKMTVRVVVRDAESTQRYEIPLDTNVRRWFPDRSVTLNVSLPAAEWFGKKMLLCLNIKDEASGYYARIANAFTFIASDGDCLLGAFQIKDE